MTRIEIPLFLKTPLDEYRFTVGQPEDDAEEKTDGTISLNSSDLEFVTDDTTQTLGIRFDRIPIERGRHIREAYLQFRCDEPTNDKTQVEIGLEQSANSPAFTTGIHDLSARSLFPDRVA